MKKFKAGNIISHIYLIILTFISIFPLVWIIISSLKGKGELTGNPTAFWPKTWTFDYYAHVINDLKFFVNIKNSVIISLVTTLMPLRWLRWRPMESSGSLRGWDRPCPRCW